MVVEGDNDWRKSTGAPDSKSVYEQLQREKEVANNGPEGKAPPPPKANR